MAQSIALRYERYVIGSTSFFNHTTDIDLSSKIVGLNFKEVPDSMLVFALISFCETVRHIMYANFEKGLRTWLYIEEMESLFKYPSVLNYFRRFSNECRKFNMYLTGITQSTESIDPQRRRKRHRQELRLHHAAQAVQGGPRVLG